MRPARPARFDGRYASRYPLDTLEQRFTGPLSSLERAGAHVAHGRVRSGTVTRVHSRARVYIDTQVLTQSDGLLECSARRVSCKAERPAAR